MRYLDEYRDRAAVEGLVAAIRSTVTRPWTIMEVCGGQTHGIVKYGLDALLPEGLELVHGPGCPVCVTPTSVLDRAQAIAARPEVVFCSFGDMLRVPGSGDAGAGSDLLALKSRGADVRVVYSPLDAIAIAEREPDREVVFFAIGFETTAPANAMAIQLAARRGLDNVSFLVSQVLVPPMLEAILSEGETRVDAFLGPGHVCAVMGLEAYRPIADRHRVPIVVSGFEPVDLLEGIRRAVGQLESGRAEVENAYARVVRDEGNPATRAVVDAVFEVSDRAWRGIGTIPRSGLALRPELAAFDAERRFALPPATPEAPSECISGRILRGLAKPPECPAFGTRCTPDAPLGATMVSAEGACAAYFAFGRGPDVDAPHVSPGALVGGRDP